MLYFGFTSSGEGTIGYLAVHKFNIFSLTIPKRSYTNCSRHRIQLLYLIHLPMARPLIRYQPFLIDADVSKVYDPQIEHVCAEHTTWPIQLLLL